MQKIHMHSSSFAQLMRDGLVDTMQVMSDGRLAVVDDGLPPGRLFEPDSKEVIALEAKRRQQRERQEQFKTSQGGR